MGYYTGPSKGYCRGYYKGYFKGLGFRILEFLSRVPAKGTLTGLFKRTIGCRVQVPLSVPSRA